MFDTPVACAVIGRTRHRMVQAEIQEAARQGAKLIEIRLDFLAKAPDFKRLLDKRPCVLIASIRRQADGGRWVGSENERMVLLRQAIIAGFDYIDLEHDIIDKIPRFGKVKRIVSYHNMQGIPDKLEAIHKHMCSADADIVKICVPAQTAADNQRVLALLKNPPKPTVAFCMGDLGTPSRLLGLCLGMPYTYAAFNRERQIAPGIIPFQEVQRIYHIEDINAETRVFGVIGDPVNHSLSPLIHNAAFQHLGINAIYVPFRVPRGELAAFLKSLRDFPVTGYSVTLPHKQTAARVSAEKDAFVSTMSAANTLLATPTGFRALNTDAPAALASLKAHLPKGDDGQPVSLASRTVLILGSGGVARAIAHVLHHEGANVTIANRTAERGEKLAAEIGCRFIDWNARHSFLCDLLVHCTPIGMHPNLDEMPIHASSLKPGLMVFDTVYTPETTMLIREARQRGCPTLTGVDMFVRQAGLQFEQFVGQPAPLELMARTLRDALSPVRAMRHDTPPPAMRPAVLAPPKTPLKPSGIKKRTTLIYLIGMRGAGKTTTARHLATKLGWAWLDADQFLQAKHGKTIREIFAEEVEKGFRDKEAKLLEELSQYEEHVIATGGGVILREGNRALLKRGTVIWLQAPAEVLWHRVQQDEASDGQRPDLAQGGLAEIEELLKSRTPLYESCHDFAVDTAQHSPEQVADAICKWLRTR
jgi:3-dehydroquinate dehydratase/shikimate dehydrogenase